MCLKAPIHPGPETLQEGPDLFICTGTGPWSHSVFIFPGENLS